MAFSRRFSGFREHLADVLDGLLLNRTSGPRIPEDRFGPTVRSLDRVVVTLGDWQRELRDEGTTEIDLEASGIDSTADYYGEFDVPFLSSESYAQSHIAAIACRLAEAVKSKHDDEVSTFAMELRLSAYYVSVVAPRVFRDHAHSLLCKALEDAARRRPKAGSQIERALGSVRTLTPECVFDLALTPDTTL